MDNTITTSHSRLFTNIPSLARWAKRAVMNRLQRITWGRIVLQDDHRTTIVGVNKGPLVTVQIHHPSFYTSLALGGGVGAGESYMAGEWSCSQLPDLIRILTRNLHVLSAVEGGWASLQRPARKFFHWLHRNTLNGSRRNIIAHYDLGNDFYKLFLDETMTYSAGIFASPEATMAEASTEKYDRLCRKLDLQASDCVIEIGGGWGGFAEHAVTHYGCHVTTTTISEEQYRYMKTRFDRAGISDKITLLKKDYRQLTGQYDKLVSIEMIEAVGHDYQPTFIKKCASLLKPEGRLALQAITITDQHYTRHIRTVDFIKRYIFPGSSLVSISHLTKLATQYTDLYLMDLEDITDHYVTTLQHWRHDFMAKLDQVKAMGFDETFIRMWEYYLCYCEGAFAEHYIGDVHLVFDKPQHRGG